MIPLARPNEVPHYQASKWLKLPMLLSLAEMEEALALLPPLIVPLSGVIQKGHEVMSKEDFLSLYADFVQKLEHGEKRPKVDSRLTCAFTDDLHNLRMMDVQKGVLTRIYFPVIQAQPYYLYYSEAAETFIDTTYTQDSFAWGLIFSIPQLFQNPETHEVEKVILPSFKALQVWSRTHTTPTSFKVDGKTVHIPARIGKKIGEKFQCMQK